MMFQLSSSAKAASHKTAVIIVGVCCVDRMGRWLAVAWMMDRQLLETSDERAWIDDSRPKTENIASRPSTTPPPRL
eukprot:scaffold500150_cov34-Prasinocladus_malaysianus.AAC.1